MKKAYILSRIHGTVQIGKTVFQPCTGARFRVSGLPRKEEIIGTIEVPDASMESARRALLQAMEEEE